MIFIGQEVSFVVFYFPSMDFNLTMFDRKAIYHRRLYSHNEKTDELTSIKVVTLKVRQDYVNAI